MISKYNSAFNFNSTKLWSLVFPISTITTLTIESNLPILLCMCNLLALICVLVCSCLFCRHGGLQSCSFQWSSFLSAALYLFLDRIVLSSGCRITKLWSLAFFSVYTFLFKQNKYFKGLQEQWTLEFSAFYCLCTVFFQTKKTFQRGAETLNSGV